VFHITYSRSSLTVEISTIDQKVQINPSFLGYLSHKFRYPHKTQYNPYPNQIGKLNQLHPIFATMAFKCYDLAADPLADCILLVSSNTAVVAVGMPDTVVAEPVDGILCLVEFVDIRYTVVDIQCTDHGHFRLCFHLQALANMAAALVGGIRLDSGAVAVAVDLGCIVEDLACTAAVEEEDLACIAVVEEEDLARIADSFLDLGLAFGYQ